MQTPPYPYPALPGPQQPTHYSSFTKDAPVVVATWHAAIQAMLNESWLLRLTVVMGAVGFVTWVARRVMHEWARRS